MFENFLDNFVFLPWCFVFSLFFFVPCCFLCVFVFPCCFVSSPFVVVGVPFCVCVCAFVLKGGGLFSKHVYIISLVLDFFFGGGVGEGYNKTPPPIQGVFSKIVNQKATKFTCCAKKKRSVSQSWPRRPVIYFCCTGCLKETL